MDVGGPRSLGIPISSTVRDAAPTGQWKISPRTARSHAEVLNDLRLYPVPNDDRGRDLYLWRHGEDKYKACFSAIRTWDQLRTRGNKESWSGLVWFSQNLPRSSFIAWLACRNRLSTGDRMRNWGILQPCLFCGERDETRDHLFFACPYTFTVWLEIGGPILGNKIDPDWHITIESIMTGSFNKTRLILLKLAFQVSIDRLWRERNERRHSGNCKTVAQISQNIDRTIRNRLHSLSYQSQPHLREIMLQWLDGR